MRWKGRRISTNVEDRRGGGGVRAGGISIIGLVVAFVAWKFFGVDPQQAYQATQQVTASQQSNATAPESLTAEQKEASDFVGTVLFKLNASILQAQKDIGHFAKAIWVII